MRWPQLSWQSWLRKILVFLGIRDKTRVAKSVVVSDGTGLGGEQPVFLVGHPEVLTMDSFQIGEPSSYCSGVLLPPLSLLIDRHGPLSWPYDLFQYQREGIEALASRPALLLADDMGLGKTVQAIAAIRVLAHQNRLEKALVVCPAGLIAQWRKAFRHTAPELRVVTVEGPVSERARYWRAPGHVFLIGYETLRQDITDGPQCPARRCEWDVVVLDEAQKIKNRDSDVSRRIKTLPRKKAWALTGTPLENKIDDLASILEFTRPMEPDGHVVHVYPGSKMQELHHRVQLRRKKADVLPQLPPKLVSTVPISLGGQQRDAYNRAERGGILDLKGRGDAVRIENVLELITRLKQICNFAPDEGQSAKFDDLVDRIRTVVAEGHKAIVYSQYVDDRFGVGRLAQLLVDFKPLVYTGQLGGKERQAVLEKFKTDPRCSVLVLSLRAGGLGLNLQEATYVFHFDRWWNPGVEMQAEDRTHRPGQVYPVNVYRYVCVGTIEERIDAILEQKRRIFDDIVDDVSLDLAARLTERELYSLFGLAPPRKNRHAQ